MNRLTSVILSVGFLLLRDVVNETAVVADAAGVLKGFFGEFETSVPIRGD